MCCALQGSKVKLWLHGKKGPLTEYAMPIINITSGQLNTIMLCLAALLTSRVSWPAHLHQLDHCFKPNGGISHAPNDAQVRCLGHDLTLLGWG